MANKESNYKLLDNCKKDPLIKAFLSKEDNLNLVRETFENPSKENYELLDKNFRDYCLKARIISYFTKLIRFGAKHYDAKLREDNERYLLVLDVEKDDKKITKKEIIMVDNSIELEETHHKCLEDYIESPELFNAIKTLTNRQKQILFLSYVKQFKDIEIAETFQVSQQSISKNRNKALIKIRGSFNG